MLTDQEQYAKIMIGEAVRKGMGLDRGTMTLALQLFGVPVCAKCDYYLKYCRCEYRDAGENI